MYLTLAISCRTTYFWGFIYVKTNQSTNQSINQSSKQSIMDNMLMYGMYDALLSSRLCHVSIFFSTFKITMHLAPCFYLESFSTWILRTSDLFGGWTEPTHLKKYDRQIGSFPQGSGWKFQQIFELPPASYFEAMATDASNFINPSMTTARHNTATRSFSLWLHLISTIFCWGSAEIMVTISASQNIIFYGRWKVNTPKLQGHRRDKPRIIVERKHPSWYLDEVATS